MSAMDGNEVTQKIRAAIKTKLVELGAYVDDELPDYIMVMIANKKTKDQMTQDLSLFLGESTISFTSWLQGVLDHLQAIAAEAKQRSREQQQQQLLASSSSRLEQEAEAIVRPVLPPHMEQQQVRQEAPPPVVAAAPPLREEEHSLPEYSDEVLALKADPEPDDDLADDLRAIVEQAPPPSRQPTASSSISLVRPIPRITAPDHSSSASSPPHASSPPREQQQQQQQRPPLKKSVVAAVVRRKPQFLSEGEEDEEEYDPSNPSVASSVVRVPERKSSVPESMQANKLLLLKAMKAANQSVSRTTRRNPSARVEPYQPTPLRELGHQSSSKRRRALSPSRASSARGDGDLDNEDPIPPPAKRSSGLSVKHRLGHRPATSAAEDSLGTDSERRGARVSRVVGAIAPKLRLDTTRAVREESMVPPPLAEATTVELNDGQVMEQEEDSDLLELEVAREEVHSVVKEATPTSTPKHQAGPMDEGAVPSVASRLGGAGDVASPSVAAVAAAAGKQQWPCFVVTLDGVDPLSFKGSGRQVLASGRDLEELPEEEEEDEAGLSAAPPRRPVKSRLITAPVAEVALMEGVVEEDEAMAVDEGGVSRVLEKCRYWPACKNGDRCPFHHPSVPCKAFPNCKFRDRCLFIHPNCKYDAFCKRKDCPFTHASRRSFASCPPPVLASPSVQQCKFFPHCTNIKCPFFHPKPCKFGAKCQSSSCPYTHPDTSVPPPNKLKWTSATLKKAPGTALA